MQYLNLNAYASYKIAMILCQLIIFIMISLLRFAYSNTAWIKCKKKINKENIKSANWFLSLRAAGENMMKNFSMKDLELLPVNMAPKYMPFLLNNKLG